MEGIAVTSTVEWHAPNYATGVLLHQLFEAQVAKTPEGTAVIYEDQSLTYRQLDDAASALASRLQALGAGSGTLVALLSERSTEMVTGMLAILKAGGAYLLLDPAHPTQRLRLIIDDARPAVLLFQDQFRAKLPSDLQVPTLGLQETCPAPGRPVPIECNLESLAYVIYTSGSAGKPKGVMIPHRGVCNFLQCIQEAYPLCPEDRVMQRLACTFDFSMQEIFWPLLTGAAVVLARPGVESDPSYLIALITAQRISTIHFVPSALALFLEDPKAASCRSLKRVFCGGESLPANLLARFFAALPDVELYNVYGPTEASITVWRCQPGDEQSSRIPIGLPLANVQVYILDEQMTPVPVGVAGELHMGGVQLALGYLGQPELTEKAFVLNPFGEGRLYKTGDLACYRPDGAIEFHGRIDHQVKLHGQRVELGEIEASLRKHPAVRDCVAAVRQDGTEANKRLVAYVVARGIGPEDLRQHAQQTLPAYMVPSVVVFLKKLPLTSNGKVDRKALSEPIAVRRENGPTPPRTALETQLVSIWEKVLRRRPIGITDNFFSELGGDSLNAASIFAEIDKVLGKRLPLRILFENPTIEKLALRIFQKPRPEHWNPLVAIQPLGKNPPFFGIHGNFLIYRKLSELLGKEQPLYGILYGIQAQGIAGVPIARTSVEDIAGYYLEEIRKVQPNGPYLLGGYSFGGLVSYEIARRLDAAGEEIALLALFDSFYPAEPARVRIRAARYRIQQVLSRGMGHILLKLKEKSHSLTSRRIIIRGKDNPPSLLDLDVQTVYTKAALAYRPLPYPKKITLFRASDQPPEYEAEPDLGWSAVAQGGIEVHNVPGNHWTLFSDEKTLLVLAGKVAECIRSCLATKESNPSSFA
jgi:amino acid adenylation domain-containing protein